MSRSNLNPRIATREDAPVLVDLWCDVLRRADRSEQVADLELVIKGAAASPEQRFVVVDVDGQVAGGVFLRLTTVSPLNLEPCVQSIQPRVFDDFRRRGVGRALMEAVFADLMMSPARRMFLEVDEQNLAAIRLYEKLGFSTISSRKGYYPRADGSAATALVMARDLG